MARPLRVEYPGAWYHVMHRGAGRRQIFRDVADRGRFLGLLGDIREIWNVEVHAYSLMDNHYHLLLHTPEGKLSRSMRHLDGVYTQRFNRAHGTDGPLFRGRFKSIIVEKESYLLELVRYIHLNPVKTGTCRRASGHRWTSHHAYLHKCKRPGWLVVDEVLSHFGKRYAEAIRRFDRFVHAGVPKELARKLSGKRLPSILGTELFRDWIKYNFVERLRSAAEIPEARATVRRRPSLRSIVQCVASVYGVPRKEIVQAARPRRNEPRAMALYLMRRVGGARHREISEFMGRVGSAAVAQAIYRFHLEMDTNEALREKVDAYTANILSNVKT